jgi:hypothetical protein
MCLAARYGTVWVVGRTAWAQRRDAQARDRRPWCAVPGSARPGNRGWFGSSFGGRPGTGPASGVIIGVRVVEESPVLSCSRAAQPSAHSREVDAKAEDEYRDRYVGDDQGGRACAGDRLTQTCLDDDQDEQGEGAKGER